MQAAAEELALTLRALTRNLKSYSAWHHRKWVIGHRLTSLEAEITLVETLLDADDRNFHGWAYRRFVADVGGAGSWGWGVAETARLWGPGRAPMVQGGSTRAAHSGS